MAATHAKTESGASRSCLDILAASGFVWGAVGDEHTENRVVHADEPARDLDDMKVVSVSMLRQH